jgi:hypothetical protein
MPNLTEVLRAKNDQEKAAMWDRIREERREYFRNLWKNAYNSTMKAEIMTVAQLESDGGNCLKCGMAWCKIQFNNQFLSGFYYQPACECNILCPECHRWLYDDDAAGLIDREPVCTNCGWKLIVDGKRRYGIEYEQREFQRDKKMELLKKIQQAKAGAQKEVFKKLNAAKKAGKI